MPVKSTTLTERRALWLGVLALTLIALFLRLFRLTEVPFGLHLDETYNAFDAYSLTRTPIWQWPLFFTSNFGREPLHIYISSLAQALFGPSHLAVRIVPALLNVAVTPALIWLGWEVAPHLPVRRRVHFALWTGAASLTLLWMQMHARIFVRGGLFLLLETLIFASFWRAWSGGGQLAADRRRMVDRERNPSHAVTLSPAHLVIRHKWWILTGFLVGLSVYTYLPARLLPGIFLLLAPVLFWQDRARFRRQWPGILLAVGVAALTAMPILLHFVFHPENFLNRSGQVSIFSDEANVSFLDQVVGVLGMAFVRGDFNIRMNLPLRPVLDLLTTVPFLIGLAVVIWRGLRPAAFFLLAVAGVMSLPTLLSLDTPNFGRAIGMLPVFGICIALGVDWLVRWADQVGARFATAAQYLAAALLVASTLLMARVYFVDWAHHPDLFHLWDEGYTRLAMHINTTEPDARVYVSPQGYDHPTTRYLLLEREAPIHGFDGRVCVRVATDVPAHYYFVFDDWFRGPGLLQSYLPDSTAQDVIADPAGNVWAQRIDQPAGGTLQFPEQTALAVPLDDGIALQGYWLSQPQLIGGDRLYVRLFWRVAETPEQNYTAFAHLIQPGSDGERQVAGADGEPGGGSCATGDWLPGEVVVDEMQFVLPTDIRAGEEYFLEVGFYTLADGQRLDVPGNDEDRILIGPLTVEP